MKVNNIARLFKAFCLKSWLCLMDPGDRTVPQRVTPNQAVVLVASSHNRHPNAPSKRNNL